MNRSVKFSLTLKNHLEQVIKLDDYIVDVEEGSLSYEINKGYASLNFVVKDVYIDSSIIADDTERVTVKWQIDDKPIIIEKFCIEAIDYLKYGNIKVYCRSATYRHEKYNLNRIATGNTLGEVISNILSDITIDTTQLTNLDFIGSLDGYNKTGFDLIEELRGVYRFEYWYREGVIYFSDMKSIKKDDIAIAKFSEIEDIESLSTSGDILKKRVKHISINAREAGIEEMKPSLKMEIIQSPQPASPTTTLTFEDDQGNVYKMTPVYANVYVYYSPDITEIPVCNITERNIVQVIEVEESISASGEGFIRTKGNIVELLDIETPTDNYSYKIGDNVIQFDTPAIGDIKVKYRTRVLHGRINPSERPKTVNIQAYFMNRVINYSHKIVQDKYYCLPFNVKINTYSDWGLQDGSNKIIEVYKYNGSSFDFITETGSNTTGDFSVHIGSYGTYKMTTADAEPLYLDYYINKKELYHSEVEDCNGNKI